MDLSSEFADAFRDFKKFFTVKHIVVTLIVAACLFLVCAPQPPVEGGSCGENSCPFPNTPVINVAPIVITEIIQENWSFDLLDDSWQDRELASPNVKVAKVNHDKACKLFLMKEPTEDPLSKHAVETIRGFTESNVKVDSIRILQINDNRFIAVMFIDGADTIWVWMSVKDNFGYTLVCGCDSNAVASQVCPNIAESLEIK